MMDEQLSAYGLLVKEILENQRAMALKLDQMATKGELSLLRAELDLVRASIDGIKSSKLPSWLSTAIISGICSTTTYIAGNLAVSLFKH
jgi:hypothetical protein